MLKAALLASISNPSSTPSFPLEKDQSLVWTGWAAILALVVFALGSGRAYAPPVARLSKPEARARAERLLARLRPADHSAMPLGAYQVAQQCQPHPVDVAQWEFAFLAPDKDHLYRLTLTATGDFRYFAVYRRNAAPEPATVSDNPAVQQQAEQWRDFLITEAKVTPVPEAPLAVRESPFPGAIRDVVRRWKTAQTAWPFVEVVFDSYGLQSLKLTAADATQPPRQNTVIGLLIGGLLALLLWLAWFFVFVRGFARREMGSRTTLVTSSVLALPLMLWLAALLVVSLAGPFTWLDPSISETRFTFLPDANRVATFVTALLAAVAVSLAALAMGVISLAVTESYDWKRNQQLLGDVYRLTRRGGLTPVQMLRLVVASVALASWILALETGVQWIAGHPMLPWHKFAAWSQSLAVGRWPGWGIIGGCFADVWLMTIWLLPLMAFVRNRLPDRSASLAVGVLLVLLGLPLVIGNWAAAVGYILLVTGLLWTLLTYGWLAVILGQLLVGGLFPLLWGLRFPNGFEPVFLVSGMLLVLPLGLLIGFGRPRRRLRRETFDLAPRYIRDRLRLERWREDREVRWLMHCNLLPPSGFQDEQQRVIAEYVHLPEQSREWFVILPLGPERVGIAVGEVGGEELQASLLVAIVLTAVKSKATHYADHPAQVVERLNDFLATRLRIIGSPIRLVYGLADFCAGTFTYCNAGYVSPVVLSPRSADNLPVPSSLTKALNPPLDGRTDLRFTEAQVHLERGSTVVLMSDWLSEIYDLPVEAPSLALRCEALFASLSERLDGNLNCDLPRTVIDYARTHLRPLPGETFAKSPAAAEITIVCVSF